MVLFSVIHCNENLKTFPCSRTGQVLRKRCFSPDLSSWSDTVDGQMLNPETAQQENGHSSYTRRDISHTSEPSFYADMTGQTIAILADGNMWGQNSNV